MLRHHSRKYYFGFALQCAGVIAIVGGIIVIMTWAASDHPFQLSTVIETFAAIVVGMVLLYLGEGQIMDAGGDRG